jgi:hypothetical protein
MSGVDAPRLRDAKASECDRLRSFVFPAKRKEQMNKLWVLILVLLCSCDDAYSRYWNGPCADESWLLATFGSHPATARCSNKMHKMRAQNLVVSPNGEMGAMVFCECQSPFSSSTAAAPSQ